MPFQKQVNMYRGVGQVGQPASASPIIAYAGGKDAFRTAEEGVMIASFVFRTSASSKFVTNKAPSADSKPLGFIQNLAQGVIGYRESQSMHIAQGVEVSPKVAGDFWATSSTIAIEGQKVFASLTDGSIATSDAGSTIAGYVETNWSVSQGAAIGDLIIISSWSK
ncbi:hypothetical protein AB7X03_17410 [Providencia rettgeri]